MFDPQSILPKVFKILTTEFPVSPVKDMMNKDSGRTTQLVFGAVGGKTVNSYTVDPPNTAALGTGEKPAVLENGGKGSHIFNQEKT